MPSPPSEPSPVAALPAADAARLATWLERLGRPAGPGVLLAGDVSTRCYLRLAGQDGGTSIAVLYPRGDRDACARFQTTTAWYQRLGLRVPAIEAADCAAGLMLVEDLGPATLFQAPPADPDLLAACFEHARQLAARIAGLESRAVAALNPPLDADLLRRELSLSWRAWAADATPPELHPATAAAFDRLCAHLAADPPRPCHRDFMVRNLVPAPAAPRLAILDHQDTRLGPPLYDLASLLNDSLFPPSELEESLLAAAGVTTPDDRLRYHRTAAQRTLKALGTYTSAAARGLPRHLPLLAPTLERALTHLAAVPEFAPLLPALRPAWRAACRSAGALLD